MRIEMEIAYFLWAWLAAGGTASWFMDRHVGTRLNEVIGMTVLGPLSWIVLITAKTLFLLRKR